MNNSSTTPSSEMCATLSVSRIKPNACGPTTGQQVAHGTQLQALAKARKDGGEQKDHRGL